MNDRDWFFIQVSDPQFGMMMPGADDFPETRLVEQAVARINDLGPAFVLCTGDLIDEPGSAKQMDRSRDLWEQLNPDIPFLVVPGNHDVGDAPTPTSLAWFRSQVGRDRLSFEHCGWHFCGLNSSLLANGESAPDETAEHWDWLADDLDRAATVAPARTVVFMHHPLFLHRGGEAEDYFNWPRGPRDKCLRLLRRFGVRTVLAGHLHRCHEASADGLEVIVTGPVGMPLAGGYSGFRIIRIRNHVLHHRFCALEDVAGQRSFLSA